MPQSELQRLQTDATSSIDFFDESMSKRERRKLMAAMSRVQPSVPQPRPQSSGSRTKQQQEEELVESEDDGEICVIEEILDKRMFNGDAIYLCRWKGMPAEDDTWEPARHVLCKEIIHEFEKEWEEVEHKASVTVLPTSSTVKAAARKAESSPVKESRNKKSKTASESNMTECYVCEKLFERSSMRASVGSKRGTDLFCSGCAA